MQPDPQIPPLGLGTYRITDEQQCVETVSTAIDIGYRCIDTAEAYQNEAAIEKALSASDVSRDDVFLATKVLHPKFAEGYTSEDIVDAASRCLDRLGVDRVELLYGVHWPGGDYDPEETFAACAELYDDGVMDRLGVCNLSQKLLEEARTVSEVPISVLQVELHPLLPQRDLREYCAEHDITLVGYAPFGNGRIFDVPELNEIATDRDVSVAQVTLAWFSHHDIPTVPKATGRDHLEDNWRSQQLELEENEIEAIDAISTTERQYDPEYAPEW